MGSDKGLGGDKPKSNAMNDFMRLGTMSAPTGNITVNGARVNNLVQNKDAA